VDTISTYGVFGNFPSKIHYTGFLKISIPLRDYARAIVESTIHLNALRDTISTTGVKTGKLAVNRSFEVGIANNLVFNFLNEPEINHLRAVLTSEKRDPSLSWLDFILFVHYRYSRHTSSRPIALRFDQYFIRCSFKKPTILFNRAAGLMRTSPEEILVLLVDFANDWLKTHEESSTRLPRIPDRGDSHGSLFVEILPGG